MAEAAKFPEFQVDYDAYRRAIERVLPELPVENGAIDVDSIWVETSLPRDLIVEIVRSGKLQLPPNVERIVVRRERARALRPEGRKSRPRKGQRERRRRKQDKRREGR